MEERPVPAPREGKRPVPTPRRSVCKPDDRVTALEPSEGKNPAGRGADEPFNTFSRRVRSASQQIAGKLRAAGTADINQLVQDRKKAVIEGTRQSVRRIRRRFSSASQEPPPETRGAASYSTDIETALDIFNSIRFDSPINRTDSVYGNVDGSDSDSSSGLPPPSHPPPPPPDESLYDAPASLSSSGNNSRGADYGYVFPLGSSKSDSDTSEAGRTIARGLELSRSDSWAYYDPEPVYDNVGSSNVPTGKGARPVKPARKHKVDLNSNLSGSSGSSESKTNSIYENHDVVFKPPAARVSQSVLMQFDPLAEVEDSENDPLPDIKLLEELLRGDLYGTVAPDRWSTSDESLPGGDPVANPPTPPLRVDSLPEDDETASSKSRSNWFTEGGADAPEPKKTWFRQVVEKAPFKGPKRSDRALERPALGDGAHVHKRGMLYKVQSGPVEDLFGEYSGRWCVLENSRLVCYSDNTCAHVKEHFAARNVLSVQALRDPKYRYRYDNDDLHCFELNTAARTRGGHVYGSRNAPERRVWMQALAESMTSRFKSRLTANYARFGWAYVREGVSGQWTGAWLLLAERELHYAADGRPVRALDLRKARCIVLQPHRETDDNPKTGDKGPNMLVDCPDVVLHLRMWTSRETKVWCHVVKAEAHDNGAHLEQQQLTRHDIPVVVDKCVNFVYAHGSMSEGIYRKSGQASLVADLLAKFRRDAFAVQLTRNTYNEFEVATALKRFFRDLPEPLFGCDHRHYLHEVAKHNDTDEKVRMFRAALEQLPPVAYGTARKLLGHLRFVADQSAKNRMTVDNLAAIWGPTLLHYEDKEAATGGGGGGHLRDSEVVAQLLRHYRRVFPEDPEELEREKLMLRVLEKHARGATVADRKTAGDFRVWIFAFSKEGRSFNVAVGPNRTAYEVCLELVDHLKTSVHELVLEEVVLGERLVRPIHHAEKVLDVVLRWGFWDEADRKDNYLVASPLSKYWEYIVDKPTPVSGELRFADAATKTFRALTFQLSQGSLTCFKDKTGETVLATWRVEDILWYLGHEAKRSPASRWTATFFEVAAPLPRTRTYFGNVLAWGDAASRAVWLGAMLKARHPRGFAPPPKLVAL